MAADDDRIERILDPSGTPSPELARDADALSLLAEADALSPPPGLKERLRRTLSTDTPFDGFVSRLAALLDLGSESVREILARASQPESSAWTETPLPGVRLQRFAGGPALAGAECAVVSVPVAGGIPRHRHSDTELSFILSGAAEDDRELALPGDLGIREAGSAHAVQAVGELPLLFVVVMKGPLDFSGD